MGPEVTGLGMGGALVLYTDFRKTRGKQGSFRRSQEVKAVGNGRHKK